MWIMFWSSAKYVHGLSSLVVCLFRSLSSFMHMVFIFIFFFIFISFLLPVLRFSFFHHSLYFFLSSSALISLAFLPFFCVSFSPVPSPALNLSYNNIVNSNDRWLYQTLPACLVFILLLLPSSDALRNDMTPESKTLNYFNARRLTLKVPHIISVSYSTVLTPSLVNCCGIRNQDRRNSRISMSVKVSAYVNVESIRFWNGAAVV